MLGSHPRICVLWPWQVWGVEPSVVVKWTRLAIAPKDGAPSPRACVPFSDPRPLESLLWSSNQSHRSPIKVACGLDQSRGPAVP